MAEALEVAVVEVGVELAVAVEVGREVKSRELEDMREEGGSGRV